MRRTRPMMGESNPQPRFYYNISLESFVPVDHPLRRVRPLIDHAAIRRECRPLYSDRGRPSIPPEQLFLALIGGYLLGVTSERRLVMELQCNMALRWFVGLNIDEDSWDASTFSQNRRRRFAKAGYKSFVPIEVTLNPEEYKERLRRQDKDDPEGPQDPGNRAVDFRGEKRSNSTHRSITDPDCRYVSKGSSGTGAYPGYTVNAVMENRNRILLGIGVEVFQGLLSERDGCLALLRRARRRFRFRPKSFGGDKGFFEQKFIESLLEDGIEPHIATDTRGSAEAHRRVRHRRWGEAYRLSQRCRKKIEELFGEGKDWHGLRRFRRRQRLRVREEAFLIGWVLNLKRLAKLLTPRVSTA